MPVSWRRAYESKGNCAMHVPFGANPVVPCIKLIVMTGLIDPVGVGRIASWARPGNNTTGISNMIQDMSAKGLELIHEVAPTAKTIRVIQSQQPRKPSDPRGC